MMQSMRSNGSPNIDLGPSSENTSAVHPRQDYELQTYLQSYAGFSEIHDHSFACHALLAW